MSKFFTRPFLKNLVLLAFIAAGAFVKAYAQGPVISYSPASAAYTQGVAITAATPTNTGTAVTQTATVSTLYSSIAGPGDMLFDSQGNFFYINIGHGTINKVTPGGVQSVFATSVDQYNQSNIGGFAIDSHDNIYFTLPNNRVIKQVTPGGTVTIFAGSLNNYGTTDGTGTAALFQSPEFIAIDKQDNLYVTDNYGTIRKITQAAVVTTFISNIPNSYYSNPHGAITTDSQSNVYYDAYNSNTGSHDLTKVSPAGVQLASYPGFGSIWGLTHDKYDDIYVADAFGNKIYQVSSAGTKTLFAGGSSGSADGDVSTAQFSFPESMAFDATGNLFIADAGNQEIRKVTITGYNIFPALPTGLVLDQSTGTISGTPTVFAASTAYQITASDGSNNSTTTFTFNVTQSPPTITNISPASVLAANPGQITVTGTNFGRSVADVSSITYGATGTESTATGVIWDSPTQLRFTAAAVTPGSVNEVTVTIVASATTSTSTFRAVIPPNITYSPNAYTYTQGTAITAVTPTNTGDVLTASATVSTIAGTGHGGNSMDGTGANAQFGYLFAMASDSQGNIYSCDGNVIHMTTPGGVVTTIATGFYNPTGIAVDAQNNIYVADNTSVQLVVKSGNTYTMSSIATGFGDARTVAVDLQGNVYVSDQPNNVIVKLTIAGGVVTNTTTFATVNQPGASAFDSHGNLIVVALNVNNFNIADLIKIAPDGTVSTLLTTINNPSSTIAIDKADNIYMADPGLSALYEITSKGVETKISNGSGYQDGDLGSSNFTNPYGITIDPTGNLYIDDASDYVIRKVTFVGYRTAPNLVDGLILDASTGTISGTPTLSIPQTTYQVTASDGQSLSTVPVTITVNQVPPVVSAIAPALVQAANPGQITLTGNFFGASAADIASITYGADGTGSTATDVIWDSSTQVRFTTTALTPGTNYKVIVTVISTPSAVSTATFRAVVPPNVVYSPNPAFFPQGTALTGVVPTNTGDPIIAGATVSTIAGTPNAGGSANGTGNAAQFNQAHGIVSDSHGNIFIADQSNNEIRKVTPAGVVTTFAGSTNVGFADGTGAAAQFNQPNGITIDTQDNLYVADQNNNSIRQITPAGVVTTFAGSTNGTADGTGTAAQFNYPTDITIDPQGNLYVFDGNSFTVRKITSAGVVTTLAGSPGVGGNTNGTGAAAQFYGNGYYTGLAADAQGNVYVGDAYNQQIRKITPAGVVTTFASGSFYILSHIAIDKSGNLYVGDAGYGTIDKILPDGTIISPFAGNNFQNGLVDGPVASAHLGQPTGLTIDPSGNLFVFDNGNEVLRKITLKGYTISPALPQGLAFDNNTGAISGTPVHVAPQQTVTITASDGFTQQNVSYAFTITQAIPTIATIFPANVSATTPGEILVNGTYLGSSLADITNVTYGPNGTGATATNVVWDNNKQLRFTPAGPLTPGATYKVIVTITGVSSAVSTATFRATVPSTVAYTGNPFVYTQTTTIAPLNPVLAGDAITAGYAVTTLAGNVNNTNDVDSTGVNAGFNFPLGVSTDAQSNIYVVDHNPATIRKVSPTGVVKTFAGSGNQGFADGQGTAASFNHPLATVADAAGNLYVTDRDNNLIRKITPGGLVSTFAGTQGTAGELDGTGTAALFNAPWGITIDTQGNLYVSDQGGNTIRKITPAGAVTTLANLNAAPNGITIDASGNIIVACGSNNTIRKVTPAGIVTTIAGIAGQAGGVNGIALSATFNNPTSVAVINNNIYITDNGYATIRNISPAGIVSTVAGAIGHNGDQDGTGTGASFDSGDMYGIAVDAQGNLLVSDNSSLRKITISGYSISPALPSGLVFNPNTAVITGTPSVVSPAATYTITALNGINTTNTSQVTITVNPLPAPVIAFANGTQTFNIGSTVTAFSPTNTGGLMTGLSSATTFAVGFSAPTGIVRDAAGNSYVASNSDNKLYKVATDGTVSVLAGSGSYASTDGMGAAASFGGLNGIAIDATGNLFVAESIGNIRMITPAGVVTTIAGSGTPGYADGVGTTAKFVAPIGLVVDATNNIYVADARMIRKMTNNSGVYTVSTFAGSNAAYGNADGIGSAASFGSLFGLTIDAQGNLFATDHDYAIIRKITPAAVVTTIKTLPGTVGSFNSLSGIALDNGGNMYVADVGRGGLYAVSPGGNVVALAGGNGSSGNVDGTGSNAQFNGLQGINFDGIGNLYAADRYNNTIRQIALSYYNITPALPSGMTFTSTAAAGGEVPVISGTAGAVTPATNYTVTAVNPGGSSTAIVNIAVTAPALPAIAYTPNTQLFVAGAAISSYTPASTGGTVTSGGSTIATFAGTGSLGLVNGANTSAQFNQPSGTAVDAQGNLYVADRGNNAIREITPAGVVTTFAGGSGAGHADGTGTAATFSAPNALTIDKDGNLYVADQSNQLIRKITPAGVVSTLAGTALSAGSTNGTGTAAKFSNPTGVAVDLLGNVYVSESSNRDVRKITSTGVVTTFAGSGTSGSTNGAGTAARFNTPDGIAVDYQGNVYVADAGNRLIRKITPAAIVTTLAGSGSSGFADGTGTAASFSTPYGMAADSLGNVYVADNSYYTIRKITPAGVVTTIAGLAGFNGAVNGTSTIATFSAPRGLSIDKSGNLYVADYSNYLIRKVAINGFTVDKALPAGLTFDQNTGTFAGTPTTVAAAKVYNVTATNYGGTASTTATISINPAAPSTQATAVTFTNVTTTGTTINWVNGNGTSRAVFIAAATAGTPAPVINTIYTANAAYTQGTQIGSTGWYNIYNGTASTVAVTGLTAGTAYRVMAVEYNTVSGLTTYQTLTATGNPANFATISTNAKLNALALSTGTLSPVFASANFAYTATVSSTVSNITVTPATDATTATVTVNGTAVASGMASANIPLTVGANTITVVVTAQDGVTKQTYTIAVTRAAITDATLTSLTLSNGLTLTPVFASGTTSYTSSAASAVTSVTVTPTTTDVNATVTVNGTAVTSGTASGTIALAVGANTITTTATAQDGVTTQTYTVIVTRGNPISNVATLSNLALSSGTLNPTFDAGTAAYVASVPNTVNSITLTPTTTNANATITVNGTAVTSGSASQSIALAAGLNTITVVSTAQDGVTQQTYTLAITRVVSGVATLNGLALSSGTLSPAFAVGTSNYTATVTNATSNVTVTPTLTDGTATVTVNGVAVANGTGSAVSLAFGANIIKTTVVAQDGKTTQTYTVVITRPALTLATLSNLGISAGTLSPVFATGTTNYTVTVPVTTDFVTVTSTFDASASATIFGSVIPNGSPSYPITVVQGTTIIPVVVTAQDGVTKITYAITITKNALTVPVEPTNILSPNGDGKNDSWTIKDIELYPNNSVTIYDRGGRVIYTKKGYTNDWAGTVNSAPLARGTYYYVVDLGNGLPTIKGFITILNTK